VHSACPTNSFELTWFTSEVKLRGELTLAVETSEAERGELTLASETERG
jgi:hypothetical protein